MDGEETSSSVKRRKMDIESFYPILTDDLIKPIGTISVFTDTIVDPRSISKVVVDLNRLFPLENLAHLKRIKGKEVILCAVGKDTEDVFNRLKEKQFNVSLLANQIKRVNVGKNPPKTRKQFDAINKLWPCNFHPNKYLEQLTANTLFNRDEINDHIEYMRIAIGVSALSDDGRKGCVIVDPQLKSVVAVGYAKTNENPCKHAVMVAIDNVACTQDGGAWRQLTASSSATPSLRGIPPELDSIAQRFPAVKFGAKLFRTKDQLIAPGDGPYLCTDYYVYMTHECCVMCAMALVHSRAKRVFFGVRQADGALESLCKIHGIKDLNHHFEVFGGLLKGEIVH